MTSTMPFDRNAIATELQQRTTVTQLVALLAVNEFFDHFFYLKKSLSDFQATKFAPSPLVDAVWRIVLVDTIKYSAMCGINFIHHESDDNQTSVDVREKRYAATRAQIRLRFGRLDEKIWPPNYLAKRVVFSDPLVIGKTGAGSKRHISTGAPSGIAKKNSSGAYTGTHKIKVSAKEYEQIEEEEEDEDYEIDVVEEVDDEDELDETTEEEQEEEAEEEEEVGEEAVEEEHGDFVKQLQKEFDNIEKTAQPELKRSTSQPNLQSLIKEMHSQGGADDDRADEPNRSNIGVFISAKNAPKFKVSIYSESDVLDLKRVVTNQLHIDAIRHQLVFQGKPLVENSKTLLEHGLNDNSTVYVREIETK